MRIRFVKLEGVLQGVAKRATLWVDHERIWANDQKAGVPRVARAFDTQFPVCDDVPPAVQGADFFSARTD